MPQIIRKTIDFLMESEKAEATSALYNYALLLLVLAVLIFLFRFLWRILSIGTSWKISRELREKLFLHLESQPPSFYRKHDTGSLLALMTNDIEAIRMSAGFGVIATLDALFMATISLALMLQIDVKLTFLALAPMPVIAIIVTKFGRLLRSRFEEVQASFADISARTREVFAGIRVIKSFAQERMESEKVSTLSGEYRDKNMNLAWIWGNFFPVVIMLAQVSLLIIIWMGGRSVIGGHISLGEFVAFTAYIGILTWPMMAVGFVTNMYQRARASITRINRILEEEPAVSDSPDAADLSKCLGRIEIKNLTFSFVNGTEPVIKDFSLTINPGETVGITGRIGSGKSTLVKLMTRLYNPPPGTILLDGMDILDIKLSDLREAVSVIPQHPFLFSDTLGSNIELGDPDAGRSKVEDLIRLVRLEENSHGREICFETEVGEEGITLSGGQKQRATIARGLIKDSSILVLDDVLSSVDTKTEEEILESLPPLIAKKTTIIIAHRISALQSADRIIVMDGGAILEDGTHEELRAGSGFYSEMCRKQKLARFGLR